LFLGQPLLCILELLQMNIRLLLLLLLLLDRHSFSVVGMSTRLYLNVIDILLVGSFHRLRLVIGE
jgi:hypothetical protein